MVHGNLLNATYLVTSAVFQYKQPLTQRHFISELLLLWQSLATVLSISHLKFTIIFYGITLNLKKVFSVFGVRWKQCLHFLFLFFSSSLLLKAASNRFAQIKNNNDIRFWNFREQQNWPNNWLMRLKISIFWSNICFIRVAWWRDRMCSHW